MCFAFFKDSEQLRSTLKRKRSVNIQNEAAKKPCGKSIANLLFEIRDMMLVKFCGNRNFLCYDFA